MPLLLTLLLVLFGAGGLTAQPATEAAARLDFFYRRHPSWDERYMLYPIYRTELELK